MCRVFCVAVIRIVGIIGDLRSDNGDRCPWKSRCKIDCASFQTISRLPQVVLLQLYLNEGNSSWNWSKGTAPEFRQWWRNSSSRSQVNLKSGQFTASSCSRTAKKCTIKRDARAELLCCSIFNPLLFFKLPLPSSSKFHNASYVLRKLTSRLWELISDANNFINVKVLDLL